MQDAAPHHKPVTMEDGLAREESMIRRVAWVGGIAVTTVTLAILVPLLMSADHDWQYPIYSALGGVPLAYALFSSLVLVQDASVAAAQAPGSANDAHVGTERDGLAG